MRFYQQLADDLPMRTPDVHYADLDDEGDRFVLLLEDLAPARPGRPARRVLAPRWPRWPSPSW